MVVEQSWLVVGLVLTLSTAPHTYKKKLLDSLLLTWLGDKSQPICHHIKGLFFLALIVLAITYMH